MYSAAEEVARLQALFGSATRYLRLLVYGGNASGAPGLLPDKSGAMPALLGEPTDGGYAPIAVTPAMWATPVAGNPGPSTMQVPKAGGLPLGWTPSGASWHNVTGYAWTSDANPISPTNFLGASAFIDRGTLLPTTFDIPDGKPFQWTETAPLVERVGGTPPGVNPS